MRASSWSTLQGHLLRQSTLQHPRSQWWPQGVFPQQPVQRSSVSRVAINRIGGLRRDDHSSRVISTARNGRVVLQALGRAGPSVTEDLDYTIFEYDAVSNGEYWSRRPVLVVKRTLEVCVAFGRWFLGGKVQGSATAEALSAQQAEKLRCILTDLGPAFVKIGQAVSSRPDVIPPGYLSELEKLQDQIPPFPDEDAYALICAEMGAPVQTIFSELSPSPIAAASLGQVYRGTLRESGQAVAVKVQRPGVREQIALDVYILRRLLAFVRQWRKVNSDLPLLLDEWATSLFKELDYRQEAANGIRFKALYGALDRVFVPDMYQNLTTKRVLIMEWVSGRRLRTSSQAVAEGVAGGQNDLELVEVGVRCSLEQMLEEGFYHSDPHPGNLLHSDDGRLAYIDFGMMGYIEPSIRRGLIRATLHLVNREFDALADDFMTLGLLPPGSDKDIIVPALTGVFQAAMAGGVSNLSFGDLSGDLGRTMYQYNFQIPAYYTLLVRSLSVLEGIALASDPNYKVLGAAYPWIARRLLTDRSPELRDTLIALLYKDGRFQFARLESLLAQAARAPGRSVLSAPDGSSPTAGGALELLLSPGVAFVRDLLLEELAKGLDSAGRLAADQLLVSARQRLSAAFGWGPAATVPPVGAFSSVPGGRLLEELLALPALAGEADKYQVDGILRLSALLQQIAEEKGVGPLSGARAGSAEQAAAALRWLVAEAAMLSPDARAEAFWLPIQLGSKVSSRLSARAVRAFLDSQPAQQRTNGAGTSSASASTGKPAAVRRAAAGTQTEASGSEPPPTMADLTGVLSVVPNMTPSGGSVIMQPLSDPSPSPTADTSGEYRLVASLESESFAIPTSSSVPSSVEISGEPPLGMREVPIAINAAVVSPRTISSSILTTEVAPGLSPIIDVGPGTDVESKNEIYPSGNRRPPVRMMDLAQPMDVRTK